MMWRTARKVAKIEGPVHSAGRVHCTATLDHQCSVVDGFRLSWRRKSAHRARDFQACSSTTSNVHRLLTCRFLLVASCSSALSQSVVKQASPIDPGFPPVIARYEPWRGGDDYRFTPPIRSTVSGRTLTTAFSDWRTMGGLRVSFAEHGTRYAPTDNSASSLSIWMNPVLRAILCTRSLRIRLRDSLPLALNQAAGCPLNSQRNASFYSSHDQRRPRSSHARQWSVIDSRGPGFYNKDRAHARGSYDWGGRGWFRRGFISERGHPQTWYAYAFRPDDGRDRPGSDLAASGSSIARDLRE